MINNIFKIDLHMHTTVSDGTDAPAEITKRVNDAGIPLFSITDHDAIKGCAEVREALKGGGPSFLPGVEFSCRDEDGRYHILGYGYDFEGKAINDLVNLGHSYRINKIKMRVDMLKEKYGISFSDDALDELFSMDNPGKPHLGNLMVEYGYANTKDEAIDKYINNLKILNKYIDPRDVIEGISESNGIAVLAHPSYGNGDQIIIGDDMDARLKKLKDYGLKGVEAFYSDFTPKLQNEMLDFAKKYDFYVTAGSDYHGTNKTVKLGDTNLCEMADYPAGLLNFLDAIKHKIYSPGEGKLYQ